MRKALLAGVGIVALAGALPASAADMAPVYKAPVMAPVAVSNWSGFYVGGHIGWGWGNTDSTVLEADNLFFPQGHVNSFDFDGFLAGGQIGYNYQSGQWVFGIEGQFSWSDVGGDTRHEAVLLDNRHTETQSNVNWAATLTGRVGYTGGAWMVYVKGGAAWADFEAHTISVRTDNGFILQETSGGETRTGWTVGVGAEWMLAGNWSVKAEYNFLDFGTEQVTRSGRNFVTDTAVSRLRDNETELHIFKLGLNYRFGGPVVARY